MTERAELDPTALRELFQAQAEALPVRVVALVTALVLFIAVFEAVRRRKLREEFTPIWLTCAAAILILAVWFDLLVWLTRAIGAWTPSSTVFFFGLAFLLAISLGYAIRLSRLSNQVQELAQELAILKAVRPEPRETGRSPADGPPG